MVYFDTGTEWAWVWSWAAGGFCEGTVGAGGGAGECGAEAVDDAAEHLSDAGDAAGRLGGLGHGVERDNVMNKL